MHVPNRNLVSSSSRSPFQRSRIAVAIAMCLGTATAVMAADETASELEEVVVTGFRGSINTALAEKRKETAAVDVIAAEDIGKFPDSNLAESMQRIPGVTLSRGDGGEGRNISVRGLGPQFTRVRINGMEGSAQMGSSDIYGAGNNGRTFDFNVFPTEIFSELKVIKTPTADIEEGSLGATVDLTAPRPFDYADNTIFTMTARGVFNSVAEDIDPRASMLVSKKFFDDTFGVLASVAYQKRNIREVGYSAVDVLSFNTNSQAVGGVAVPFCTPLNWTLSQQMPATNLIKGSDANNCSTGGTLTFQWQPTENTSLAIDGLMSKYQVERRDNYLLGLSFGRSLAQNGQPMVSVRDIEFDEHGSLVYGLFDGVDVRSEGLVD